MNIQELIKADANITIAVSLMDLKEFALSLMDEARKQGEQQPREDKELNAQEAADVLGISTNSLWRWEKSGYLKPHARIGKRPMYLQSQIEKLKGGF